MGLNEVASAERVHITFFGMTNVGKSSLVNAVTGQDLCVVSEIEGTTTDPVKKAMELLPLGPVVVVDTPGLYDSTSLGKLRMEKAIGALDYTDIAILVVDAVKGLKDGDRELISQFEAKKIPYIVTHNKADLLDSVPQGKDNNIYVSATKKIGIEQLKELLGKFAKPNDKKIVGDILSGGDIAVLVVPIDSAAPKGRLIMPQQQTIRDILDSGAVAVVARPEELAGTLDRIGKPKIVITDSQAFGVVSKIVPNDVMLTSFSILFARYKGNLPTLVKGAAVIDDLRDGDKILIAEGCTHHRQCEDIGTVKIPKWLNAHTGKKLVFEYSSGTQFLDPSDCRLVIHCGGCMLNEQEMKSRVARAVQCGVPITNYGVAIAHMHGILRRSLSPFGDIAAILDERGKA